MFTGAFKDARFGPFSNLHTCISLVEVCRFGECMPGLKIFAHLYPFFPSRVFARLAMRQTRVFGGVSQTMLTGLFKNTSFGPPPNLHKRISLVEVYGFGQCLGW